jgi:tRNA pseudouridine13 synthase
MKDNNFITDLAYITKELPGVGGKIREKAEYFSVEEIPLYNPSGDGNHLYVNLTREGMTTRDIQKHLAGIFNVKPEKVGCAGMKDKNAKVIQTFSIEVGNQESDFVEDFIQDSMEKITQTLSVTVNWARLHNNKIRIGHLIGNMFKIRITGLSMEPIIALERANAIANQINKTGVPNFYGPQRFGFDGENVDRGLEIIQGKYSPDDKWLRRLLISSYQSYLCNRYLAKRVETGNFARILEGDIAKKHDTGGMFKVEDSTKEQPRYDSNEISFTAPIYGSGMTETTGIAGKMEAQVLEESEVTMEQLDKAGANGTRRLGRIFVPDIVIKGEENTLILTFSLPKGAFATTILREIMKTDF